MALEDALSPVLRTLRGRAAGVFLWGSHASRTAHARSDVDLCVVAGPGRDVEEVERLLWREVVTDRVDAKVFETLPLFLQGAVLDADHLLYAEDEVALYEYLRPVRVRWADQRHRQLVDADDVRRALAE